MRCAWIALLLVLVPVIAQAASWAVCDLTIQTKASEANGIRAVIVSASETNGRNPGSARTCATVS
jgi:hypothetical protein